MPTRAPERAIQAQQPSGQAPAEQQPAETHRAAQAAIAAAAVPLVVNAWERLLDPHELRATTPKLAAAVQAIIARFGPAAAAAGLAFYRQRRVEAGVTGRINLPMPPLPSQGKVAALVEATVSPLYGPVDQTQVTNVADALASEVQQLVLDQGRRAVMDASQIDKEAKGWARVTEPDACSFCRLLATRGAVYGSRGSADFRAHTRLPNGTGGTCRCHVEPKFANYEPTAQARTDLAAYQQIADTYGHSGRDLLIAWRQHVEGREVTGPLVKPYKRTGQRI